MRLIDADKLIMAIANWQQTLMPGWEAPNDADTIVYKTLEEVCKLIGDRPTAYDVEAVVRELEEVFKRYYGKAVWKNQYLTQKVIEIVRGGRNEA